MTPAAQTMTPTDEEMAAWCEALLRDTAEAKKSRRCSPTMAVRFDHDIEMLRAIAKRLRKGRHG